MNAPLTRIVVADANVLINLTQVSRLGLLAQIPQHEFVVPDHVREEITDVGQRSLLEQAISSGWLKPESITDLAAVSAFTDLVTRVGRGEAACIVLAEKNGWYIASDEKRRFRREAESRMGTGRILGTADLIVLAIKAGLLTVEEADADKMALEARKFKLPFASYRELVE